MGKVSRRTFLKTAAGGAASGLALGGFPAIVKSKTKPIKWGFLDCISGTFGVFGKGNVGGTKLAIKKINDAGGILGRHVELVIEDTEANTEIAARKARKLILKDKVDVVQGAASTSTTTVIGKICGQHKTIHFNSEWDASTVLQAKSDYDFNIVPLCEEFERASMLGIKKTFSPSEIKRWYIFYPDYSYGRDMRDVYKRELTKWVPGAEIAGMATHPLGEADYSTHIVKMLDLKPQVVVSCQWAGDTLNFIKQAIPYGFFDKVPIFRFNAASISAIVALKDKLPSVYTLTEQGNPYFPHMKDWLNEYKDYIGEWPVTEMPPAYYDAVYMYKEAVEKAGTTESKAVAKALEGLDYRGPSGRRRMRKDHQADVEYIAFVKMVDSKEFEWKVPSMSIKVPYEQVKLSGDEMVKLGCKWCKGRY